MITGLDWLNAHNKKKNNVINKIAYLEENSKLQDF